MAGITHLDNQDIEDLARRFDLGGVGGWRPIEAGTINSNFQLDCVAGRFMLRVNEGKSEADVAYEAELVGQLARSGIATPAPASAGPRPYALHGDKLVSVFPWIAGQHLDGEALGQGHLATLGKSLAELHRAADGLSSLPERFGLYTFEAMVRRAEGVRQRQDPVLAPVLELIFDEIDWQKRTPQHSTPVGIIHGDLFPDNVLWVGEKISALLDFEQASLGRRAYDLAVCVNAWCFLEEFSAPRVAAIVKGYCAEGAGVDTEELYRELRRAALRFTITRITDLYLRGIDNPLKDFRRYQRRLESWRALGGIGLRRWLADS